jgi:hypothetical protein
MQTGFRCREIGAMARIFAWNLLAIKPPTYRIHVGIKFTGN